MGKFAEVEAWLEVEVERPSGGLYEHALATERPGARPSVLPKLSAVIAEAHADARRRIRRLATGSLDPLGDNSVTDPSLGYPGLLHIQTLKGCFGEVVAGIVAENLSPFTYDDWVVPAHLFRFHVVAFQQLAYMKQTGVVAKLLPGRTGDDCVAFRRGPGGNIIAALFCEAKCTADHDAGLISDAHEKSSLPNLLPVDLLQIIDVLEDSPDPGAQTWIVELRRLSLDNAPPGFERIDQITYVCGRPPSQKGRKSWIATDSVHPKYTGGRRLHIAELHLPDVETLVRAVYPQA